MLNIVTELLDGGLGIRHFIEPFSQRLAVRTHLKSSGFPYREK